MFALNFYFVKASYLKYVIYKRENSVNNKIPNTPNVTQHLKACFGTYYQTASGDIVEDQWWKRRLNKIE
jgi:LysM repeat protein